MENNFLRITTLVKELITYVVDSGDTVVDATVGNGEDTLLLAKKTGKSGMVYGFDIQKQALNSAKKKLDDQGITSGIELIQRGHENMKDVLKSKGIYPETVKAIVFNLGYLPGGDHHCVTTVETTMIALKDGLSLLSPKGMIMVSLYPGHPEGKKESKAVLNWCKTLEKSFVVHHFETINREAPPTLVMIQRMR